MDETTSPRIPSSSPSAPFSSLVCFIGIGVFLWAAGSAPIETPLCDGIHFRANSRWFHLSYPAMRGGDKAPFGKSVRLMRWDTMSNWFSPSRGYVEIIRQDHPTNPLYGLALGFEFHDSIHIFPHAPTYVRAHFKDFSWGGKEFSRADSFNYTGLNNDVSNDLSLRVTDFHNDTIRGVFSAVLISGAGPMLHIDSGYFCVLLRRVEP